MAHAYIDKLPDNDSCHIVTGSNYQAGIEAVNVLYELGHRRIAGFFCERLMPDRMNSVVDALNARGIKDDEKFIYCSRNFNSYDAGIFLKNINNFKRIVTIFYITTPNFSIKLHIL